MKRYLPLILSLLAFIAAKAQTPDTAGNANKKDRAILKHDSVIEKPFRFEAPKPKKEQIYHPDSNHSPKKAVLKSLMLPGLGQIYNRHGLWWRLPALYTGLYLLGDAIIFYNQQYQIFLAESQWRENGRPTTQAEPYKEYNVYPDQSIYNAKDGYRRNRDISIFSFVGVWGINMVDAYVEAKFIHSYTMDDNLSFKVTPSIIGQPVYASNFNSTFTPALKITFLFK